MTDSTSTLILSELRDIKAGQLDIFQRLAVVETKVSDSSQLARINSLEKDVQELKDSRTYLRGWLAAAGSAIALISSLVTTAAIKWVPVLVTHLLPAKK